MPTEVTKAIGEYYEIPVKEIGETPIPNETLAYIPEESALHYRFVPIEVNDGVLSVGIVDPDMIEAKAALNFISSRINMPFKLFVISEEDFDKGDWYVPWSFRRGRKGTFSTRTCCLWGVTFDLDSAERAEKQGADKKLSKKLLKKRQLPKSLQRFCDTPQKAMRPTCISSICAKQFEFVFELTVF